MVTATSAGITVKGYAGDLAVDDGGNGSSTPVLFVHSYAGSSEQWRPQLEHLRASRRAIAFDWRGHGESDPSPTNDYSIPAIAEDIEVVADKLSLNRFVLVGHSMGAAAAIAYAAKHPERVAGLVIEGIGGKMDDKIAQPMLDAIEKDYDKTMEEYWHKLMTDAAPHTRSQVNHDKLVLNETQSLAMIHATFAYDPLPDLGQYDGPKLTVIAASGDTPFALHRLMPGLPVEKIEGTSHWTHLDKPAEFNRILDAFLAHVDVIA